MKEESVLVILIEVFDLRSRDIIFTSSDVVDFDGFDNCFRDFQDRLDRGLGGYRFNGYYNYETDCFVLSDEFACMYGARVKYGEYNYKFVFDGIFITEIFTEFKTPVFVDGKNHVEE
jgi:hypothetical protein